MSVTDVFLRPPMRPNKPPSSTDQVLRDYMHKSRKSMRTGLPHQNLLAFRCSRVRVTVGLPTASSVNSIIHSSSFPVPPIVDVD